MDMNGHYQPRSEFFRHPWQFAESEVGTCFFCPQFKKVCIPMQPVNMNLGANPDHQLRGARWVSLSSE